jgi:chaperonin GroES
LLVYTFVYLPTHIFGLSGVPARIMVLRVAKKSNKSESSRRDKGVASKIRPVGDRVVVKPAQKEEVTKSGIVIPDTAKEKPQEGTIIAVGTGKLNDKGDRTPLEVKEGDRVLFAKYGGTEFKYEDEDLLVLRESDILAVLTGEK